MRKKTAIGSSLALGLLLAGGLLYSFLIGFERDSLAHKLPDDTYASFSVRHLRKIGLAFATDEQLQASSKVFQAFGKIMGDSFPTLDYPGGQVDKELFASLAKHFKTQLTLAALPSAEESAHETELALLSDFYGSTDDFANTLSAVTKQASNAKLSLNWEQENWEEFSYQTLVISALDNTLAIPNLDICWAVHDETLYICTQRAALQKLLRHAASENPASTATAIAKHKTSSQLAKPDVTLFVNSNPCLELLANSIQKELTQAGGFATSFSPKTFFRELDLDQIESLVLAIEFTGDRTVYSSLTYKESIKLFSSLGSNPRTTTPRIERTPIFATETLSIDTGAVLLTVKDAVLKAAPLANFPYFGLNSQLKIQTGIDIESTLSTAFAPRVTSLQTFDFGTGRNPFGETEEQVVFDSAYQFALREKQTLTTLIESQIPKLLESQSPLAYQEDNTLYIDSYNDSSLTSDRFALSYTDNDITVGYGTLKAFNELRGRAERRTQAASNHNPNATPVGNGALLMSHLPTTLFQFAGVLYQQVNNTPNIPTAFLDFDWASLTILEQNRESTSYHDPSGHLFRVSRQLDQHH